jgi:hypothetical protein
MNRLLSSEPGSRQMSLPAIEASVARFRERVDAAQLAAPSTRDFVSKAIGRQGPGRCPVMLNSLSYDVIVRYSDDLADLFCEFPDDVVFIEPYEMTIGYQGPEVDARINPVEVLTQDAEWTDEWGTRWGHAVGGVGAHQIGFPLQDWSALDDYLARRFPDPRAAGRMGAAEAVLRKFKGSKYCIGMIPLTLKARLISLRGTENVLMDLYTNEDELRRLSDAVSQYVLEMIRQWGQLGVDSVFITDDWGTQSAMLISPAMWRSFFKPYYRAMIHEAHKLGMDFFFHSCGNVMQIIGDFVEMDVDVLNPLQPGAMDLGEIASRFGGQISFCGAIDVQYLLPTGTPQQIRDTMRRIIDTLGSPFGDGLILAPANVMGPDVPIDNLRAMFEGCHC